MANQTSECKQERIRMDNLKKKTARKQSFRTTSTSYDEFDEQSDVQTTERTSPANSQNGHFLTVSPRNQINDSLNRTLDEEIRKQLSKKRKNFNWLRLNTSGQCKTLKAIKKGIVKIDASIQKSRDKLEHIMACEVHLQQQFLVGVRFIDLADEHLLRMSKVNRNLKYSAWFAEVQQTKRKIIEISESRLLFNAQLLNETLLSMERDMKATKDQIEQNLHNQSELKTYAKLVGQSSARIKSLKKHMDKEFRKLYAKLDLKQATLPKVHRFCISIIRLLDILLHYFKKTNCGCDLIVRTILVRKELAILANYA